MGWTIFTARHFSSSLFGLFIRNFQFNSEIFAKRLPFAKKASNSLIYALNEPCHLLERAHRLINPQELDARTKERADELRPQTTRKRNTQKHLLARWNHVPLYQLIVNKTKWIQTKYEKKNREKSNSESQPTMDDVRESILNLLCRLSKQQYIGPSTMLRCFDAAAIRKYNTREILFPNRIHSWNYALLGAIFRNVTMWCHQSAVAQRLSNNNIVKAIVTSSIIEPVSVQCSIPWCQLSGRTRSIIDAR